MSYIKLHVLTKYDSYKRNCSKIEPHPARCAER